MPSPFPGMDPYLEPHWLDVHTALIGEARRVLNRSLPVGLVARAEERVAIETPEGELQRIGPDVRVISPASADGVLPGGVLIEAPYKLVLDVDPLIERYIRIVDEVGELVSVVEFISPTNKRPPGLSDYHEKREQLLTAGVHVVEIDLVRAGDWRALMRPEVTPAEASAAPYRATVRTGARPRAAYLFPIFLRETLPDVPVPLRAAETPVKLPLQQLVQAVYDDGRYAATLDYSRRLNPPLEPADVEWLVHRVNPIA